MTDYNTMRQYVNGKVFEPKGPDNAFHIHQLKSQLIAFCGPEYYNKNIFMQLASIDKKIFEQLQDAVMSGLKPNNSNIDKVYEQLTGNDQP